MTVASNKSELVEQISKIGVIGSINEGSFDSLFGSGAGGSGGVIKWRVGTGTTYTPTEADKDTLVIFNQASVTIDFGIQSPGTATEAWYSMVVNKGGPLNFTGDIISYADQADQNVMIGIIRTASEWVVSGSNIADGA